MNDVARDLRYSLRRIGRRPGFTLVVVMTLALGIGATTGIFSVVDAVLLRPLPYKSPDRLVLLWGDETGRRTGSSWASFPDFVDFEAQVRSFEGLAAWSNASATLSRQGGDPIRVPLRRVTHDLFPLLGISPASGRGFLPEEDRVGAEPVVLLDHGFWAQNLGGEPSALGSSLVLDGQPYTIVGIMPEGLNFGEADIFIPLSPEHAEDSRGAHRILPVARLREGVSLEEADAEVRAVAARLEETYPDHNSNRSAYLQPLHDAVVGQVSTALWVVFGLVGLVLLIACANVANLFVARTAELGRDVAIRRALGGGHRHVLRQLGTESLVLGICGGTAGVLLAVGSLGVLKAMAPAGIPRIAEVGLDGVVLAFAGGLTLLTGMAFTLPPALQAMRVDLHQTLKQGGRTAAGARSGRLLQMVVVLQVALAVVAVVAAGLLLNSFLKLQKVEAGFSDEDVLVVPLALPEGQYWTRGDPEEDGSRAVGFYREVERRIASIPGVTSVAAAYMHPLSGGWESSFWLPGVLEAPEGLRPEARIRPVTPGYFGTVGMPLLRGRDFTKQDGLHAPGVVIVNESFARTFFPEGEPIGHRVARGAWWSGQPEEFEIVGVVGDVKMDGLDEDVPTALYFPHAQFPFSDLNVVVASSTNPSALIPAIRQEIWEVDPKLPVENARTLGEIRTLSVAAERFRTGLVALFAAVALLLSAIGIYGVITYSVARRTREMGLRMSLGAQVLDVLWLVVRQGMTVTGIGLAVGVSVALLITDLMSSLLFGVSSTDPATFLAVSGLFAAIALLACLIPAVRATRVDPVVALRAE
ncbi:MAG: ABC transporter permease [Gemmatimonadales bacterium]|jgi:putative ABC transport system permease protein